jgi:hypothetical protein
MSMMISITKTEKIVTSNKGLLLALHGSQSESNNTIFSHILDHRCPHECIPVYTYLQAKFRGDQVSEMSALSINVRLPVGCSAAAADHNRTLQGRRFNDECTKIPGLEGL